VADTIDTRVVDLYRVIQQFECGLLDATDAVEQLTELCAPSDGRPRIVQRHDIQTRRPYLALDRQHGRQGLTFAIPETPDANKQPPTPE
jgi:hypothetical protein